MSIQSEINRIEGLRDDSFDEVTAKGGTVPVGATLEDLPAAIRSISTSDVEYNIYNTITELGLISGYATISDVWSLLPNYTIIISPSEEWATSDLPNASIYGAIEICKQNISDRDDHGWIIFRGRRVTDGLYTMRFTGGDNTAPSGIWEPILQSYISSSADLDDFKTPGLYYLGAAENAPNSASNGWLLVLAASNATRKQVWLRHGSNPTTFKDFYIRLYNSSEWGSWVKMATSDDIPSPSSAAPKALGTAAAGSGTAYSRYDHVHPKPSAADIGAVADAGSTGSVTLSATGITFSNTNLVKRNGIVFFQTTMSVEKTVGTGAISIGTLPSGYRPSFTVRARFPGTISTSLATQNADVVFNTSINTSGVISIQRSPQPNFTDGTRMNFVFPIPV